MNLATHMRDFAPKQYKRRLMPIVSLMFYALLVAFTAGLVREVFS